MSLPVPNLDDRTFLDLVMAARDRIKNTCPRWTDLSVGDPGMALIEAFAYLTDVLNYKTNQVPAKAYVSFLNLLGVSLHAPYAAWAEITFSRTGKDVAAIHIPAGTRIAAARGADPQPVVFMTTEPATLPEGAAEIVVRAHHCDVIEAELLGVGTGLPGQAHQTGTTPIAHTTESLDLLLGIAVPTGSIDVGAAAREYGGKIFEIWRPVHSFAGATPADKVYLIDRSTGSITFAPALDLRQPDGLTTLAAVPGQGREIRLWYRTGGGPVGNVAAETLTNLRDPIQGVKATNKTPARGGRGLEPLDSALLRGPYEFFSQQRAVTARDFEVLATGGAVARARAFTRAAVLSYARPGEVEVVLVPHVPDQARPAGRLTVPVLREHEVEEARRRTEEDLNRRRALGTSVRATWSKYKAVSVHAKVFVRPEEDVDAVRRRIHERLYQTISPLPTVHSKSGWAFGEPLRASNVYRMLEQAEPGVRYVDNVRFVVDEAPDQAVRGVAADRYQPKTWYAGAGEVVFRSANGGQGWEVVGRFPGETVTQVVPAPAPLRPGIVSRAGAVAVVTHQAGGSRIYLSADLGDTWTLLAGLMPVVTSLAWIDRDSSGSLLLATDVGLYEASLIAGAVPLPIQVDPSDSDRAFYAVASFVSERGAPGVALAAQAQQGVYLSLDGGRPGTFRHIGLSNTDCRVVAVQYDGPATLLWTGVGEPDPKRAGQGCFRTRLYEPDVVWQPLSTGWAGGTCRGLAFAGRLAIAATQSGGVIRLDTASSQLSWQPAHVNCGLPLRDRTRFDPVDSIAVSSEGPLFAGGTKGVYRSDDAFRWQAAANQETADVVTVPDTWLICSGQHQIEVMRSDAAPGD